MNTIVAPLPMPEQPHVPDAQHRALITYDYLGQSILVATPPDGEVAERFLGAQKEIQTMTNEATMLGALAVSGSSGLSSGKLVRATGLTPRQVNRAFRQFEGSDAYQGIVSATAGHRVIEGKIKERELHQDIPFSVASRWLSPADRETLVVMKKEKDAADAQRALRLSERKEYFDAIHTVRTEFELREQEVVERIAELTDGLSTPAFVAIMERERSRIYRRDPDQLPEIVFKANEDATDERMEERVQDIMVVLEALSEVSNGESISMIDMADSINQLSRTDLSVTLANIKRRITLSRVNPGENFYPVAADLTEDVPGRSGKRGSSGIRKTGDFATFVLQTETESVNR